MRARAAAAVLAATTLATVAAVVPLALAVGSAHGWVLAFDRRVSAEAHVFGRAHPLSVDVLAAVSWLGTGAVGLVCLVPAVIWLVRAQRGAVAVYAVVCVALPPLFIEPAKRLVHRPRPVFADPFAHADGYSFPSGHAVHVVTYALVVAVLLPPDWPRRWRAAAVGTGALAALMVGWSRVALGVHYPSDVAAGWALGAGWVAAVTLVFVSLCHARPRWPPAPRQPVRAGAAGGGG